MKKYRVSFIVKTSDDDTSDSIKDIIKEYLDIATSKSEEYAGTEDFEGYSYLKVKAL